MNYELAKELKDAGFPQKGTWEDHYGLKYWSIYDGAASKDNPQVIDGEEANFGFMENLFYIPTLTELIEACGRDFYSLTFTGETWSAVVLGERMGVSAPTPKEAVARLWLALNKK